MAVIVICRNPRKLLSKVYRAIDDDEIPSWSYDDAGDFTYVGQSGQWEDRAWLRPRVTEQGNLVLNIVAPDAGMTELVYAIFHGRFIEMLLAHFDRDMEAARATAQASQSDIV